MATYDSMKSMLRARKANRPGNDDGKEGPIDHVVASVCATFVQCCCVMQPDVVLSRYQACAVDSKTTPLDVATGMLRREGPLSLWRGWGVMFARQLPTGLLQWTIFEQLRRLAGVGYGFG